MTWKKVCYLCRRLPRTLAYVLCYELVFGEGLKPFGPSERALLKASDKLISASETLKKENNVSDLSEISTSSKFAVHPRTARVNTLKISVQGALQELQAEENALGVSSLCILNVQHRSRFFDSYKEVYVCLSPAGLEVWLFACSRASFERLFQINKLLMSLNLLTSVPM